MLKRKSETKNINLIRKFSSPKPFLRPTEYIFDGFTSTIRIENCSYGHAVNIKVKITANVIDQNCGSHENVWLSYEGYNVIPYINGTENIGYYMYDKDCESTYLKATYAENFMIDIKYESDSGAKVDSI